MKKRINVWAAALAVIGMAVAVPMRAEAATAAELATAIDGWSGGGTGTLDAIASGNEVTVTGTVTGATTALSLNIDAGVTVLWQASLSGDGARITLSGGGLFQMENGSAITQSGSSGNAISILSTHSVSLNINGGTVSSNSVSAAAINTNGTGTITINSGTVLSTNYSCAISNGLGAVIINGGKVETNGNAYGNGAISSGDPNSSVTITGGEVLATAPGGTALVIGGTLSMTDGTISANNGSDACGIRIILSSATVTISGGTVSATDGSAIDNTEGGNVTIHGTVTINGNILGNIIRYFVPPTGLPDLTGMTAAMLAFFALSAALWAYVFIPRRKFGRG